MISWNTLTHFGDITMTAIAALAIGGWLLAEKEKRLALWWALLFLGGLSLVVASKIAFIGWGVGIAALDFAGVSGHAMRATAVWPVLAFLGCQRARRTIRWIGVLGGMGFALLIAYSRLVLQVHSVSEVVAGSLLGLLVSAGFFWVASSLRRRIIKPARVAMVIAMLLPAPYVQPAPTQKWLTSVSLLVSGNDQPCMRARDSFVCPLETREQVAQPDL